MPVLKAYEGPERPRQELATIKCDPGVQVHAIDGNKQLRTGAVSNLNFYRDCDITVLPGEHVVDVCYDRSGRYGSQEVIDRCDKDVPVSRSFQLGRVYRIKFFTSSTGWTPWIADESANP
jgi:hypothetical protein